MDCFTQNTDALAWLDAPSTSEDDMMFMDLITTPTAAACAQRLLETALPAKQSQRQVSSPPQVVPKALPPFPGPHDAPAAFMQNCWGLAQQPWDIQEPCAAISGPIADLDFSLVPDAPAAWDAHQLVPRFDANSAEQLHAPGSLPGLAPQHVSAGFSSGPSTLSAQFPVGFSRAAPAAPWSLSSTELRQQLPPVLECFHPLPHSSLCAGIGCSASPACLVPEACSAAIPRPASTGTLSAGEESAATVAAVLAAAAQPHAAPGGQGPLQYNPSLASAAGIDRFHAAVHTLPLPRDIGSAGSATPAAGSSMPVQRAAAEHAQQAAMLAAGGALLPALPLKSSARTAGLAVSAVPGGCGSGSGSGSISRGSTLKCSGPVMKPPAAIMNRPASGAVVMPPRPAQVQRRRSGLEEALQTSAVEAEESKIQALASRRAILQSTVQALQDSRAQLAANLDTLLTDLTMMSARNQQLKAANRQVQAQVQALVLQLQQTSLRAA